MDSVATNSHSAYQAKPLFTDHPAMGVSGGSRGSFLGKTVRWVSSSLPSLPYSAKKVRQDQCPLIEHAVTKTETQRLIGLHGDDGLFACRLADGWSTLPDINEALRISAATRTILRLNNITIFRNTPSDGSLSSSMIGPNHYFGVLDNTHDFFCHIQLNQAGIPVFVKDAAACEQCLPVAEIPACYISTQESALWLSGKLRDNLHMIGSDANIAKRQQALTRDLGILIFGSEADVISLPGFDARQFDLSPFGAKLVKNDQPFKITDSVEDPMDVVTYHFGENYAKKIVQEREGLFLETHNFTQLISPVTEDSGGFITLGKWHNGNLDLIGVEVPYGYSIIVSKGTIHGDSTLVGSYLMAMTVNHNTMATADVVFLKNRNNKNVMVTLGSDIQQTGRVPSSSAALPSGCGPGFNDRGIKPLVVMPDGPLKRNFDEDIRSQKRPLDQVVRTGSSIVYNPANSADWYLRTI